MVGPKPVKPKSVKTAKVSSFEKPTSVKKEKKAAPVVKTPEVKEKQKKSEKKLVSSTEGNGVKKTQVTECVNAFKKLVEIHNADSKGLFDDEGKKINLQIGGIKIPRESEKQVVKLQLPHSPQSGNMDVCLFVKDLEKGLKVDHEDTIHHFEDLLRKNNVQGVTQIISLRELKVEYKQYEAKLQLCHKFDKFLADSRIIRLLPQFLGKHFYKRKKIPLQINLGAKDLASEFSKCLKVTTLALSNTGSTSMVSVGQSSLPVDSLVDNITAVLDKLDTKYPGGWKNIRSIHLSAVGGANTSLPLYVSLRPVKEVGMVAGKKRVVKEAVTDELSTIVGGEVTVTPAGKVKVKRKADPNWTEADETLRKMSKEEEKGEDEEEEKEVKKTEAVKDKAKDEESDSDIDDQELEYMKKVAEEEEEMEKKLDENDEKIQKQLEKEEEPEGSENEDDDEEEEESDKEDVDDDAEAENLVSDGDESDSEAEDILMGKTLKDIDEEIENDPPEQKKKKPSKKELKKQTKKSQKEVIQMKATAKDKKQQKFIAKKKNEKVSKSKKK